MKRLGRSVKLFLGVIRDCLSLTARQRIRCMPLRCFKLRVQSMTAIMYTSTDLLWALMFPKSSPGAVREANRNSIITKSSIGL